MAAPDYHTAEGLFLGGGHGLDTRFQRFRFPGLLKRRDEKGWKEKRVGPQQSKSLSLRWAKYYASFDTGNAVSAHSVWAISTSLPQIHTVTTHHKIHWQHKTFLHEIKYFELGNILQNHKGFIHKTFLSGLTQIIMKKKNLHCRCNQFSWRSEWNPKDRTWVMGTWWFILRHSPFLRRLTLKGVQHSF